MKTRPQATSEPEPSAHESDQGESATAFAAFATHAIAEGIQSLHLDPEFLSWGQSTAEAAVNIAAPIRRAFKNHPALVGAGIGTIAAGFALIGFALLREGPGRTIATKHVN